MPRLVSAVLLCHVVSISHHSEAATLKSKSLTRLHISPRVDKTVSTVAASNSRFRHLFWFPAADATDAADAAAAVALAAVTAAATAAPAVGISCH